MSIPEPEFQNWLNHARSVGYTDEEIRALLLKAGWPIEHVNAEMGRRGLQTGSAASNQKGKVVHGLPKHVAQARSIYFIKLALILLVAAVAWVASIYLWRM